MLVSALKVADFVLNDGLNIFLKLLNFHFLLSKCKVERGRHKGPDDA